MVYLLRCWLAGAALVMGLSACGGGSSGDSKSTSSTTTPPTTAPTTPATPTTPTTPTAPAPAPPGTVTVTTIPPTDNEASRFLTQSTYGPTDADIASVVSTGYAGWIDGQIAAPRSSPQLPYCVSRNNTNTQGTDAQLEALLKQAALGQDQLRLRMALAWSHIFVVSGFDGGVSYRLCPMASYWDTLHANALGNFRTLLEQVTLHPEMGIYLSMLQNDKGNPATGLQPDENFAREVMQLMTIGVVKLNMDGTRMTDSTGSAIPAYSHDDVAGLAKALTGFYLYNPSPSDQGWGGYCFTCDPQFNFDTVSMSAYPTHHSTLEKTFLGKTIAASAVSDPLGDLKTALDTLFNHPNTAPFIATRLIKQFVTSNPSPAYVKRVAMVFADNGAGVRGDLAAVIRAVLLDSEARDASIAQDPNFGKLREPLLRFTGWMRAFGAISQGYVKNGPDGPSYLMYPMHPGDRFAEQPLWAPSVFDFWRPDYSPPNSLLSAQGLEASEFQVVDEVSLAGYMNSMASVINTGAGYFWDGSRYSDIYSEYANEKALAGDETKLVARVDKLLTAGQMTDVLRSDLVSAVKQVVVPSGTGITADQINAALRTRAQLAIYLTMISPEYLAQR